MKAMTKDEIYEVMATLGGRIEFIDVDGETHTGYFTGFSNRYDTENGEGEICYEDDEGWCTLLYESDILSIKKIDKPKE